MSFGTASRLGNFAFVKRKDRIMAMNATMEILGTKMWDMSPELLHHYKQTIDSNLLLRAQFDKGETEAGVPYFMSASTGFEEKIYAGDANRINRYYGEDMDQTDVIVNVVPVEGPIIRSGDACSYGSKQYRDRLMQAADIPNCVGHLIYIDTPGGSAFAKNDFQYAIDYVKSKNQPIIALVDGLCASAGMALAAMCDEIWFVNPLDRIGSIGTMCAFYATPDGVVDAVSQDRFVEVYGSKSEWKNKEYRDAALGNYEELQKEVDELNEQFWNIIKTYRPQVQEEQMHGKVYNCGDVVGTLTDGQGTMQSCIDRILELAGVQTMAAPSQPGSGAGQAASGNGDLQSVEVPEISEDFTGEDPVQDAGPESAEETTAETIQESNNPEDKTTDETVVPGSLAVAESSQTPERTMKQYPRIMAALNLNELASDKENGLYLHEALADAMESFLANAEIVKNTRDAKIEEASSLNVKIEELKEEHSKAVVSMQEAHAQEIEELKQAHQAEMDEKENQHGQALEALSAEKNGEIESLNGQLAEAKAAIEGLNGQVEAKEAELQEISEATAEPMRPAAPTADGVETAEAAMFETKSVINSDMTPEEKIAALHKRNEELAKLIG